MVLVVVASAKSVFQVLGGNVFAVFVGQALHGGDDFDRHGVWLQATVIEFGDVKQIFKEFAQVPTGVVGLGEVLAGTVVNGGRLGTEGQTQIALNGRHRSAHFVRGGRNKFGLLVFFGELLGDIAESDDFVLGRAASGDHSEVDGHLALIVASDD